MTARAPSSHRSRSSAGGCPARPWSAPQRRSSAAARRADRVRLAPYTRTAIQMGIAVGAAIALGDLLSGRRFYWAVIAAFVTFMGANNSGEQVRKALFRVAGTVVGIGSRLAARRRRRPPHLLVDRGDPGRPVLRLLPDADQLRLHGRRHHRDGLPALRAARRVLRTRCCCSASRRRPSAQPSQSSWSCSCFRCAPAGSCASPSGTTSRRSGGWPSTPASGCWARTTTSSHAALRRPCIDAAYQAVTATAQPLRRNLSGTINEDTGQALRLASASRNYSRNLVADAEAASPLDAGRAWTSNWPAPPCINPWTWSPPPSPAPGTESTPDRRRSSTRPSAASRNAPAPQGRPARYPRPQAHRRHHGPDGRNPRARHHRLRHRNRHAWRRRRHRIYGRVPSPDGSGAPAALALIDSKGLQAARSVAGQAPPTGSTRPASELACCSPPPNRTTSAATTVVVRERANGGAAADRTVANVLLAATRLAGRTAS